MTGHTCFLGWIAPPCRDLTPQKARRWLRRSHGKWSYLAGAGFEAPKSLRIGASVLLTDTRMMVEACEIALRTGETVRLESAGDGAPLERVEKSVAALHGLAELERAVAEGTLHRGAPPLETGLRTLVERSLRAAERRLEEARRDAA